MRTVLNIPRQAHKCDQVSPAEQSPVAWNCSTPIFSVLLYSHRDELPSHKTKEKMLQTLLC